MAMMTRPEVTVLSNGGKTWENQYESFYLKSYIPETKIDGKVNNYTFRQPLLVVLEENRKTMEDAVSFAEESGLAKIASQYDSQVLFVYPTCEGGWKNATIKIYQDLISEVRLYPDYKDGICEVHDFFSHQFQGYYIRGAIFRADIYSYGESADFAAKNLLKTIQGQYLWGPGEITPALVSMERLSVKPEVERKDIAVLSVSNSLNVNNAFEGCKNLLVKEKADIYVDFMNFGRKFKVWCGNMEYEPDLDALGMVEEAGQCTVKTSKTNWNIKAEKEPEHKAGYFAYYNKGLLDKEPVPMVVGFHGGGDSSLFFTYVTGWWQVCHDHNFLYVGLENHQNLPAEEVVQVIEHLKEKYNVDSSRIYGAGFSMGSGKTWDMFQEYPDVFAAVAPGSGLFPLHNNPFGKSIEDGINMDVSVPMFYSGGEKSHVPELPKDAQSALDRIQYLAGVNKFKKKSQFDALKFDNKESWEDKFYGVKGENVRVIHDDSRNADLTVHYFESEDGVTRTALAWVSDQMHEYRHHTADEAWKFISQFSK